jgi:hypothetical protein
MFQTCALKESNPRKVELADRRDLIEVQSASPARKGHDESARNFLPGYSPKSHFRSRRESIHSFDNTHFGDV